jgi:hypothetical protein
MTENDAKMLKILNVHQGNTKGLRQSLKQFEMEAYGSCFVS